MPTLSFHNMENLTKMAKLLEQNKDKESILVEEHEDDVRAFLYAV